MPNQSKPRVIVVLGMHRSGTSALTKSLALFRSTLSDDTIPTTSNNPKGYWEDKNIVDINERLLSQLGTRWCDLLKADAYSADVWKDPGLIGDAVEIVRRNLERAPLWGFKDPRTCRTLPFWKQVFCKVDCDVVYTLCIRNPLNVASSLRIRDALASSHSYLLWAEHVFHSLVNTNDEQRIVIDYDSLLRDPLTQLNRIAEAFALPGIDPNSSNFLEYSRDFLDTSLCHNTENIEALKHNQHIPDFVRKLYLELLEAADGNQALSSDVIGKCLSDTQSALSCSDSINAALNSLVHENRGTQLELVKSRADTEQQRKNAEQQEEKLEKVLSSKSWRFAQMLQMLARYARLSGRKCR